MRNLKIAMMEWLKAGLSPNKVAIAVALGMSLGLFPIYGLSFIACTVAAWLARLNMPIILAGCYAVSFLKPLLILPYLRVGEWLFRADPLPVSLLELSRRFSDNALAALREFGWSFVHAASGWAVTLPALMVGLYLLNHFLIKCWTNRSRKLTG